MDVVKWCGRFPTTVIVGIVKKASPKASS